MPKELVDALLHLISFTPVVLGTIWGALIWIAWELKGIRQGLEKRS